MKLLFSIIALGLLGCNQQRNQKTVQGNWIKGSESDQITTIEKQFRGFDKAMIETGYRYQELYWAGQDKNWEYADYQLDKIKVAIESGLERRPKRAKSAEHFLTLVIPEMRKAIKSKDTALFNKDFKTMTINCNNCHAMEKVPFFTVKMPINRQSPIQK
ncbi:hypothetical protein [Flavobacterium sandaracinum]|uniref:Cytochrome c domain-containing protein n=1 Tax=Flavobacterium sandaracinum TaxID=2541733 RepID=A0A4R5D2M9_9FLAO|nr:hypothetical protein [Flavobacterium sandaracinum]TDE05721.1 hypothetical protein E0F91_05865 [Flavobacterium sandaracinum]